MIIFPRSLLRYISPLQRGKSRLLLWFRIWRELIPESSWGRLVLIVSAIYDSLIFIISPKLAPSPKSLCDLQLYAHRLDTHFSIRKGTDDIYSILPFREMDVHDAILGKLIPGDVFIDGGLMLGTIRYSEQKLLA